MGSHHTAVIVEPGCYVYMFGQNSEGQLGIGNTKSTTGPVKMQALSNEKVLVSIIFFFTRSWPWTIPFLFFFLYVKNTNCMPKHSQANFRLQS